MPASSFKIVRTIQAPPELVFAAWTEAGGLREWFCREAHTDPRKDGQFRVGWWSGYHAHGRFIVFSPPQRLRFKWLGLGEPGETNVKVTLRPTDGGTRLTLTHSGFGIGKKWAGQAQGAAREWNRVLDNLRSVLETGIDPRAARQPRVGLRFETAKGMAGIVVTSVLPDGPAERAGLQKDDIIVRFNGQPIRSEADFMFVFFKCHPGQRVRASYWRGDVRSAMTIVLGMRPVPEIPEDPAVLVDNVCKVHAQALASVRACVSAIDEAQAEQPPAAGEWSVKQALAHLSASERGFQVWVVDTLLGRETGWIEGQFPEQMAAIAATAPTANAIVERFERDLTESRTMVAALTPEHRAWRVRYRRIAQMFLDFAEHTQEHVQQIEKTVQQVTR
jgi:uncharacterized protein YndB with AHSA1/START domain/uncharacterized damage-inducible protein DinB